MEIIITLILVIGGIAFILILSGCLSWDLPESDRKKDVILQMLNASRMERLCMAAGLCQLPCGCKCGFRGSSDEMEKHFDECEIYSGRIMDLIRERNE